MKKIALLFSLFALLCGCYVQSVNVFFTPDLVTTVPDIKGEWISVVQLGKSLAGKNIHPWKFGDKLVDTYDDRNKYGQLEVVYFKVGDSLFMDFTAGNISKDTGYYPSVYWAAGVFPCHSLCKLTLKKDSLVLIPLNYDWFYERIKGKKLSLKYIKPQGSETNYLFLADSSSWVQFLKKYADDTGVFDPKYRFVFKRKKSNG